ncbi:MAG: hypothetical protein WD757_08930 [Actinomycetota bacterium]
MTVEFTDEEPNGLAGILGDLIRTNLEHHPERRSLLKPASFAVTAYDIGLSATIEMKSDKVVVTNGVAAGNAAISVRADATTLIELSSVPLRFGMPDLLKAGGRRIVRKLLSGKMRVKGLLAHAPSVARLNKLLSVT